MYLIKLKKIKNKIIRKDNLTYMHLNNNSLKYKVRLLLILNKAQKMLKPMFKVLFQKIMNKSNTVSLNWRKISKLEIIKFRIKISKFKILIKNEQSTLLQESN